MRVPRSVRRIVWDWNGTLLDDLALCIEVMNGLLADAGLPLLSRERYQRVFDFPVRAYYERLGFDLSGGRWEELAERFIRRYDEGVGECALHPGAVDLLGALGREGVESSVLTAARRTSVEVLLQDHGARDLVGDVVGLDDHYAGGKVELGLGWLGRVEADPATTVLVGDTIHDHEVAEAMGIPCILYSRGHHARERLEATGRDVVDSFGALRERLGR